MVASPFARGELEVRRAPLLGEGTAEILARVCGYDEARIAALAAAGVLGAVPAADGD